MKAMKLKWTFWFPQSPISHCRYGISPLENFIIKSLAPVLAATHIYISNSCFKKFCAELGSLYRYFCNNLKNHRPETSIHNIHVLNMDWAILPISLLNVYLLFGFVIKNIYFHLIPVMSRFLLRVIQWY